MTKTIDQGHHFGCPFFFFFEKNSRYFKNYLYLCSFDTIKINKK